MGKNALRDRLLSLAGVDIKAARSVGSPGTSTAEAIAQFGEALVAAEVIFAAKTAQYGLFTDHRDADPSMGFFEQFTDLSRKYTRLRQFARARIAGEPRPFKEVVDTCSDLAVYALMMTILAHRYSETFDEPAASSPGTGDGNWAAATDKRDPDI
jgi:hypothetical protein